ncbi:MAG TPA: hypothetical protein VFI72_17585 [Candidatus Angelobacter sp.]|nr:hypothetical protein [Candidatus Angelobacter sp.]
MLQRIFPVLFIALCFVAGSHAQTGTSSSSSNNPASPSSTPTPSPKEAADASKKAKDASAAAAIVEQNLAADGALLINAARYQKAITEITGATSARPQVPIEDLRTLQATVLAIQQNDLVNAMSKAASALNKNDSKTIEGDRKSKCDALPSSSQQDVVDAVKACSKADSDATDQAKALSDQVTSFKAALQSIYVYVSNQVGAPLPKLEPAGALAAKNPDASELLQKLAPSMSAMRGALENLNEYQSTWATINPLLNGWGVSAPGPDNAGKTPPKPDDQLKLVKDKINSVIPKLSGWFESLTASLTASAGSLDGMLTGVGTDPAKNNASALQAVSDRTTDVSNAQGIVNAWYSMVGFLQDGEPSTFNLKVTRSNVDTLQKAVNAVRASISRLSDATAGNASDFETAQVSLYYFFNVQQLMEALNGNVRSVGGVEEARQAASEQRKALTQAELDLADAQATVNRYQKQVLDLQEQQRQLRNKLKGQNSSLSKLSNRLQSALDAKKTTDDDLAAAQQSSDADKSGEVNRATAQQTAAAGRVSQAQSDYDAAKADRDNTQAQLDGSQNQSDSLPAKLTAAQQALGESQAAVSAQRRRMIMAAQAESDAFAFARDNAPFLYAPADAASTDPAKRVMLYAYVDSKTIFMRGKREDIAEVKRIISEFDKPAPQARLTLWTFELSADSGQKTNKAAAGKLNDAMDIIDQELGDTRALENTALALLRDLINQQVQSYAAESAKSARPPCLAQFATAGDYDKFDRIAFYDKTVLTQLGFEPCNPESLRRLVPDPAGTTTLGEALLVLSLARGQTKLQIRNDFETLIGRKLAELPLKKSSWPPKLGAPTTFLPLTWHALGIWEQDVVKDPAGLTSTQLEITRALRTWYDSRLLHDILDGRLESIILEYGERNRQLAGLQKQLDGLVEAAPLKLDGTEKATLIRLESIDRAQLTKDEASQLDRLILKGITLQGQEANYANLWWQENQTSASLSNIRNDAVNIGVTLRAYGANIGDITDLLSKAANTPGGSSTLRTTLRQALASLLGSGSIAQINAGLNGATPRVAAADEMLKSLLIALEDDLSRDFVQPMIKRVRERLTTEAGVRVGVVQRESMLATNRGKARIDPRASAQLAVGTEQDILTGIQQLAQLYMVAQSGGALAALGALQQQPREAGPEIYALTTGNKFEVTPVFDPSGQALRFKFDFVGSTGLQEPNGSTSAQLPRIERHTINTEVQLSNLETREISRFESNARVGRATEYSGGVPVLKDIPYVRPWVPLIGWFVRKAGSNAVAQQSVIFGQTTIYPTIGALIDLATDSGLPTIPGGSGSQSQYPRAELSPQNEK